VVGISETRFLRETWFLETLSTLKCSATLCISVAKNKESDIGKLLTLGHCEEAFCADEAISTLQIGGLLRKKRSQ